MSRIGWVVVSLMASAGCSDRAVVVPDGGAALPARDASVVADSGGLDASDGGTPDSGDPRHGSPCATEAECPAGWKCLYWSASCQTAGRCEASCPMYVDAGATLCLCDGREVYSSCATEPYYQMFAGFERPDAASRCSGYDGGF